MTACISIQPQGVAALMADCVVTYRNPPPALAIEGDFPEHYRALARQFRGACRKIYKIGDNIAVACSGDVEKIKQFLDDATMYCGYIDGMIASRSFDDESRPLDIITNLSNTYTGIGIIAQCVHSRSDGTHAVNDQWVNESKRFVSKLYGPVCFSGSSGFTIAEVVDATDRAEINWRHMDMANPGDAIISLNDSLNYRASAAALRHCARGLPPPDWGGVFETLIKPGPDQPWRWRERAVQLFVEIEQVGSGHFTWRQVPVFVAHQPLAAKYEILLVS